MNETIRQRTQWGGIAALVACLAVAGWNGSVVQSQVSATGAPPSVSDAAAVGLPSLGALAGGLTAILAFVAKWWKPSTPGGTSTLALLQAIAVLIDAGAGEQAKALIESLKSNGFPPEGVVEFKWPGKPAAGLRWGAVAPPIKAVEGSRP